MGGRGGGGGALGGERQLFHQLRLKPVPNPAVLSDPQTPSALQVLGHCTILAPASPAAGRVPSQGSLSLAVGRHCSLLEEDLESRRKLETTTQ
jgi:hypothetical protein